jgi:integrase
MLPGLTDLLASVPEDLRSGWVVNPLPVEKDGRTGRSPGDRLTKERVGRVIAMIGRKAGIVVQRADEETGRRVKYASAHDLRRGCAQRLINAGVSAETLKVLMRHNDFATTEKHYEAGA